MDAALIVTSVLYILGCMYGCTCPYVRTDTHPPKRISIRKFILWAGLSLYGF